MDDGGMKLEHRHYCRVGPCYRRHCLSYYPQSARTEEIGSRNLVSVE